MERYAVFLDWKNQYCENDYTTQSNLQIQSIHIKLPMAFCTELEHTILQFIATKQQPEKAMAPHSSILAWRIPGTGEPGGLPSMGSHRVGHNWGDLAAAAAANNNSEEGMATHSSILA